MTGEPIVRLIFKTKLCLSGFSLGGSISTCTINICTVNLLYCTVQFDYNCRTESCRYILCIFIQYTVKKFIENQKNNWLSGKKYWVPIHQKTGWVWIRNPTYFHILSKENRHYGHWRVGRTGLAARYRAIISIYHPISPPTCSLLIILTLPTLCHNVTA